MLLGGWLLSPCVVGWVGSCSPSPGAPLSFLSLRTDTSYRLKGGDRGARYRQGWGRWHSKGDIHTNTCTPTNMHPGNNEHKTENTHTQKYVDTHFLIYTNLSLHWYAHVIMHLMLLTGSDTLSPPYTLLTQKTLTNKRSFEPIAMCSSLHFTVQIQR